MLLRSLAVTALALALTGGAALAQTMEATPIPAAAKTGFRADDVFRRHLVVHHEERAPADPTLSTSVNTHRRERPLARREGRQQTDVVVSYVGHSVDMVTYDSDAKHLIGFIETD